MIIGKGGETIKYLQLQSGAKIQVTRDMDADPNSATRGVELMGTPEQVAKAEQLINDVLSEVLCIAAILFTAFIYVLMTILFGTIKMVDTELAILTVTLVSPLAVIVFNSYTFKCLSPLSSLSNSLY